VRGVNAREIHEFLNDMWESVFEINDELRSELNGEGFKVEPVEEVFGAYIFIGGEWRRMSYPHPAFEIKPQMEVGATPEGYYFVVAVPRGRISESFVGLFLESFPRGFIYGANDFLKDLYNWKRDRQVSPAEVMDRIMKSGEQVFQFEANFDSTKTLKQGIKRVIALGKRFEIFEL